MIRNERHKTGGLPGYSCSNPKQTLTEAAEQTSPRCKRALGGCGEVRKALCEVDCIVVISESGHLSNDGLGEQSGLL